jgi:alginate O-acetyltransferase complex protein AlgI
VFDGIERFCIGLAKKVLIADVLGEVANQAFVDDLTLITPGFAWLGLICYSMQIYFDFSGYSDMAIGLGLMLGFRFTENFDRPYLSRSITEFWTRWHITLSNWMKDYLYIPLGGNRVSARRTLVNIWIVFLLSGLWHGAQWTFVVWGAFHGLFLSIEKYSMRERLRVPQLLRVPLTFLIVLCGWVFFRCESLSQAGNYFRTLSLYGALEARGNAMSLATVQSYHWFTLVVALSLTFVAPPLLSRREQMAGLLFRVPGLQLRFLSILLMYTFSVMALAAAEFHPFIYFRF